MNRDEDKYPAGSDEWWEARWSREEAEDAAHADFIRAEQEARLDQMEYSMGIEPRGWQDSY